MRFSYLTLTFLFVATVCFAQKKTIDFEAIDSLYREDQFYLNLSFINLQKEPSSVSQIKISPQIGFGFLRDMPVNKNRTVSVALGLGYNIAILNHNLFIDNSNEKVTYSSINQEFDRNKLSLHYIDVPLELRWRTSTPETHVFWRIYTGFKVSYLVYDQYKFKGETTIKSSKNNDLNQFQYGAYLSTGWNTWNFYVYYGLNPLFQSAQLDNQNIDMYNFNFGLMFYIL